MREKVAFIGLQTGDEGKGVRVAYYVKKAVGTGKPVLVLRWQGGANAGHTSVMNGVTYKLHQLPSGILIPGTFNLSGEGVFFNPRKAVREIKELWERGIKVDATNFGIASNTHITFDYHIAEDSADFNKAKHTSTGSGIKQTAVDKVGRVGIRFEEFLDRNTFIEILKKKFPNGLPKELPKEFGNFGSFEEFSASYDMEREFLRDFSVLQSDVITHYWKNGIIIGEGAQGFRLDVDRGLYPGITSSNPSMVPFRVDTVFGLVKLYESSVGSDRVFVGQMPSELESRLRNEWGERGTTTGKDRDLGWFDAVAVKYAVESTGTDCLVGTCGDRLEALAEIGEKPKIVVAYKINGKTYGSWDKSFHNRRVLYDAEPIFEEFEPWEKFAVDGKMTPNAQKYMDRIQELVGVPFASVGTGPGVDDVIEF